MAEPAEKREPDALDALLQRFDKLLSDQERAVRALEMIAQNEQRKLSERDDSARRAASKAGPTTPEAEAEVARRHKKWGIK